MGGANSQPTYTINDLIPSNNMLTLPISDFNGYTSLKLIATNSSDTITSTIIAYQYLPIKPSFIIKPGTSFDILNPQIILEPNEALDSVTLNTLTNSDISFSFIINNNKVTIQTVNDEQEAIVNGETLTEADFYTIATSNDNYVITFNPKEFSTIMSMIDPNGS
ncbi:hypothetical protein IKS57_04050 [bacterium]|nr:hypothetical protein [bacterium]